MSRWTEDNTEGFSIEELATLNEAQQRLESAHPDVDPSNLADRLNNAFFHGVTIEELTQRAGLQN
jgi:type I restriction-modification system DNA methylase subunit